MKKAVLVFAAALAAGCGKPRPHALTIAAAANLTGVMDEIAAEFQKASGVHATVSYGSTAQLAQQIDNGAPFDVFAAADTEHVDALIAKGKLKRESRAIYAKGQLALWAPALAIERLEDLQKPEVKAIAIAKPELAPYGAAAVAALKAAQIWQAVESKIVYANNISMARQFAATGNADATLTAYSLVMKEKGTVLRIHPSLYKPIEQAVATTTEDNAARFRTFLLGQGGQRILAAHGYLSGR